MIEHLDTAGADAGLPSAGADAGLPSAGADAVLPSAGADAVLPSAGADAVLPSAGADAVLPSAGADAVLPSAGADAATSPGDTSDDPPEAEPQQWWRNAVALIGFVVRRTFVLPVVEGRMSGRGWTPGLRAVVWISLATFVGLTVLAFAAPLLRSQLTLGLQSSGATFPVVLLPVLIMAVSATLALVATAALRVRWWAQVIVLVVLAGILLWAPLLGGSVLGLAGVLGALIGYLVLLVVRRRKPFVVWEFVVLLFVIGTAVSGNLILSTPGFDTGVDLRLTNFLTWYLPLFGLATPIAILAGVAMAEITIATVTWSVSSVVRTLRARETGHRPFRFTRVLGWLGLVVVTGLLLVREVLEFADRDTVGLTLRGAGLFVLVGALVVPVLWWADRRSLRRPDADDVVDDWPRASLPVGLLVGAPFLYGVLSQVLGVLTLGTVSTAMASFGGDHQTDIVLLIGAVGLYGLAWRRAVAGQASVAVIYAAISAVLILSAVVSWLGIAASLSGLRAGGWLTAVVLVVVLAVRRRLTSERAVALGVVLVVSGVYGFRELIYEPLTYVVGLFGLSFGLVAGLLWRLLTDSGWTRADTAGFPQASRVMLAVANLLFGALAMAVVALGGGNLQLDLEQFEGIGDQLVGSGLWAGVCIAAVVLAWRGERVRSS